MKTPLGIRMFAVCAALATTGAACAVPPPPSVEAPSSTSRSVFVVGDSLAYASQADLKTSLAGVGDTVTFRTFPGTKVAWAADSLSKGLNKGRVDVAIVISGTNNLSMDPVSDEDIADIERAANQAGRAKCTLWVIPAARHYPMEDGERVITEYDPGVSEAIRDAAASRSDFFVAEWDLFSYDHPGWRVADGTHHTTAGQREFVKYIASEADRRCGTGV